MLDSKRLPPPSRTTLTVMFGSLFVLLGANASWCPPNDCATNADCGSGQVCILAACESKPAAVSRPSRLWGVDANYVQTFENNGYKWKVGSDWVDPIVSLANHGAQVFRLRIWVDNHTGNQEPGTLSDARIMAHRAQKAGMYVVPTLFMSRGWGADNAQDAPLNWASLSLTERAAAAKQWARDAVSQLVDDGISTRTFAIGNETDYGFCGVFQITDDLDYLKTVIWPDAAVLMKATIEGVQEASNQNNLEFILHLSRGYDADLVVGFFETMIAQGVPVSFAGLSYYPSAWGQFGAAKFSLTVSRLYNELGLKVFLAEYAYPAADTWAGWNTQVGSYTLDEAGQALFVKDMKNRVFNYPNYEGAIYWSPEEVYSGADWSVMSLFKPSATAMSSGARPALDEL